MRNDAQDLQKLSFWFVCIRVLELIKYYIVGEITFVIHTILDEIHQNWRHCSICKTHRTMRNDFYSTLSVILSSSKTGYFSLYPSSLIYNRETVSILYYFVSRFSLQILIYNRETVSILYYFVSRFSLQIHSLQIHVE